MKFSGIIGELRWMCDRLSVRLFAMLLFLFMLSSYWWKMPSVVRKL